MPAIHEVATLTSKGQITLPKSIRQALGVDTGGKVAFDLRGGEVVVTRADVEHEDPAIAAFLTLLARDIEAGRNVRGLPEDLARTMLEHAGHKVDLSSARKRSQPDPSEIAQEQRLPGRMLRRQVLRQHGEHRPARSQ